VAVVKEAVLENLRRIAQFEDSHDMSEFRAGWRWHHVSIDGATLSRLVTKGYLHMVSRSGTHTGYRLSELGRQAIALADEEVAARASVPDEPVSPDGLFGDIIGHDEVKRLLRAALLAERPVHVLLSGPPALAKSLFLWDIESAAAGRALWLLGSGTSKSGLWDKVASDRPRFILIDELDKMNASDTASLLSIMEGGRLVRAKKGRELDLRSQVRVVAASNHLSNLSPELKSRFAICRLRTYSRSDYLKVVRGVLINRENTTPELAERIASLLDGRSQDVRDAIKAARLAPNMDVAAAVESIIRGKSEGSE
jgi:Holliday junction DNA helicase RuvB